MKYWYELNQRFAEGRAKGRAEVEEELRLLSERLEADGRASEAIKVLSDPEFRAHELEMYGIVVPPADETLAQ